MIDPPGLSFDHLRYGQADQSQSRDHIDLEHLCQHLIGHVERRSLSDVGCAVVHQNVCRAENLLGLADQILQMIGASHVALDTMNFAGKRRVLLSRGLKILHLAAGNYHVAPDSANRCVMALPMPRPPPVTMATLPERLNPLMIFKLLVWK